MELEYVLRVTMITVMSILIITMAVMTLLERFGKERIDQRLLRRYHILVKATNYMDTSPPHMMTSVRKHLMLIHMINIMTTDTYMGEGIDPGIAVLVDLDPLTEKDLQEDDYHEYRTHMAVLRNLVGHPLPSDTAQERAAASLRAIYWICDHRINGGR